MSGADRARFSAIINGGQHGHVVSYERKAMRSITWLKSHVEASGGADYVLTSDLDDDDALRDDFCAYVHALIRQRAAPQTLAPLLFLVVKRRFNGIFELSQIRPWACVSRWV